MTSPGKTSRSGGSAADWARVAELLKSGDLDRAERALDQASEGDPNSLNACLIRARIAWARGKTSNAIALLRRTATNYPKSSAVHVTLADLYLELDRPELALESASTAERLEPSATGRVVIARVRGEIHERLFDWENNSTGSRALDATQFHAELESPEALRWSDAPPGTFEDATVPMKGGAGPAARPSQPAPTGAGLERAQMRALLLADVFDGVEANTHVWAGATKKKRGNLPRKVERIAFMVFIGSFAIGGASLLTVGVERTAQLKVDVMVQDLRHLLQNGSFGHAEKLLGELEAAAAAGNVEQDYQDLFNLAHAMLWRFHDDAPAHLEAAMRAEAAVKTPSVERRLTRAVLGIESRPKEVIADLTPLVQALNDSPHPSLLIALASCRLKDARAAEAAFTRAEELEPPHLPYLYAQLGHWVGVKKLGNAAEALDRMTDISPRSPWTRLGEALLGRLSPEEIQALIDDPESPPVVKRRARNLLPKVELSP